MNRALENKRIVITRAPEQSGELTAALAALGATVLSMPTVSFAPVPDTTHLDEYVARLGSFDWVAFTSQNAVRFVRERILALGVDAKPAAVGKLSVATVGPATSLAANEAGFRVTYSARNASGEALASELARFVAAKSVLLPRSDRADDRLLSGLREAGAEVTDVVAYRTLGAEEVNAEALAEVRAGRVDAILFASPSAFHNLADAISLPELAMLSMKVNFAAIGPTTARALREAGARVSIQPTQSSAILLADAVAKFYAGQPATLAAEAETR